MQPPKPYVRTDEHGVMRVGDTRVTVQFTRTGESCFAAVREIDGPPLRLHIEVGARPEET